MTNKERNALISSPAGGLENIGSGPKSILSGMVSDALALVRAREKSLATARFRIGDYEFRDPDYRQILIWAKALELEPEDFINGLKDCFAESCTEFELIYFEAGLEVEDGSIVTLVWDFDCFPISSFEWVDGLRIEGLGLWGSATTEISLRLPLLNSLACAGCGLTELDLSKVPALIWLDCSRNSLIELDISMVPALTYLYCDRNQLVELDLSAVPALTELSCGNNQLVELDLSTVPALTELSCGGNEFVELDIRKLGQLIYLFYYESTGLKKLPTQSPKGYR